MRGWWAARCWSGRTACAIRRHCHANSPGTEPFSPCDMRRMAVATGNDQPPYENRERLASIRRVARMRAAPCWT